MLPPSFPFPADALLFFRAREWIPTGPPRGVILLIHGLSDHSGRYIHVGDFFAGAGYATVIPDLRGHGLSFGKRGHFPSYNAIMDDLRFFLKETRKRFPGLPVILYGHSMGGNLVLNYLIRFKPEVSGAVVTSPWLRLNMPPPVLKVLLANFVNKIFPALTQADGIVPSFLSHDESVGKSYATDPLVHSRISVRTFLEISRAGIYALDHAADLECPLLLMHGTGDLLTSSNATEEFAGKLNSPYVFKPCEGMYHELHNEVEKEVVLGFIQQWLEP